MNIFHNARKWERAARKIEFLALAIAALCLFSNAISSQAREMQGDSRAIAAYRRMHEAFRRARSVSIESEYIWEVDGREIGRSNYSLKLKKPNYARLESASADGKRYGIVILDGKTMWISWPTGNHSGSSQPGSETQQGVPRAFMRKEAQAGVHSIGSEVNRLGTGMTMPILDPSLFHGLPDVMDPYLEILVFIGKEEVGGEVCDVIEAEFPGRNRIRRFWIASSDNLPRMLVEKVWTEREVTRREQWRNVSVNEPMSKEIFTLKSNADWIELNPYSQWEALIAPGTVAPNFELELIDGSRFVLSEHRGKVVWLCFWHLSCLPCREELAYLSSIQKRYGSKDLVVLGIDFADDETSVRDYLDSQKISLASAVDTSVHGRDLFYRQYQRQGTRSAVPLNYIIDRNGKIADAWYGFEKGSRQGIATLKRLGVSK